MLRHAVVALALLAGLCLPVAATIRIDVAYPQSNTQLNITENVTAQGIGTIRGQITTDTPTMIHVYVSTLNVVFNSGANSFTAGVHGTIGGKPVSTIPVQIYITPEMPALIDLSVEPQAQSAVLLTAGNYSAAPVQIFVQSDN